MGTQASSNKKQQQKKYEKRVSLIQYNQDKTIQAQLAQLHNRRSQNSIELQDFQGYDLLFENHISIKMDTSKQYKSFKTTKYFNDFNDLQAYFSNIIKISKLLNIQMYDDLTIQHLESTYSLTISIEISDFQIISKSQEIRSSFEKKMNCLIYIANLLRKIKNIYFRPQHLLYSPQGIFLINFEISSLTPEQLFLGFIRYFFSSERVQSFQQCCEIDALMPQGMPIYLQEIYINLVSNKEDLESYLIENQINCIKDKLIFLMGRIDSFYACSYFRKTEKFMTEKQWIFLKHNHEIFFYHIQDSHACHGKIIRKKRKINLQDLHLVFDPEELQILYVPENSKLIVKASQFDLQQYSTTSDIEIKYKLPIKLKNPLLCQANNSNGQLLILQSYLYRYIPQTNKLIQITKKISDYLFVTNSKELQYLIIKLSIDIFKNGIRVFYKNQEKILGFTGDPAILEEISSIRIDIKSVNCCMEVYKGVFFMMASRNFWILDLNFECFFSFAPPNQIKKLKRSIQVAHQSSQSEMIFNIINQPFNVSLNQCASQNNVAITSKYFHILGRIQGKPYYLRYKFIHKIGALCLEGYQPVFVFSPFKSLKMKKDGVEFQTYHFNFHQQSSHVYKYSNWIFSGQNFLKVYNFEIKWQKTNYEVFLQIEAYDQTLKQYLESLKKNMVKVNRRQIILLLYKVYKIYEYLFLNSITHRNFSVNNLCFTKNQELKIHGWSEPSRNWHISDFKDYLLTCFNIITLQSFEKLSQKIINLHQAQLFEYPIFNEKLNATLKQAKNIQKKVQIQKTMQKFKCYLEKQLCQNFHNVSSNDFIFSFEYNTPRFNMYDTKNQKMKKITIIPEQRAQQFRFSETDKYAWNQSDHALYIFTASYQFFQAKISKQYVVQQKIVLEDYEYLPFNISESTFVCIDHHIFSFGGIKKQGNSKSVYCTDIFKFNWISLMWQPISTLSEPRINPKTAISSDRKSIYIIGGLTDHQFKFFKPIMFNLSDNKCKLLIDRSVANPIACLPYSSPIKVFHLNKQLNLFMFWYMQNGNYVIQYFSCLSTGFNISINVKSFMQDQEINNLSVSIDQNHIHILRVYGKYTKISINNLDSAIIKNQTIYAL